MLLAALLLQPCSPGLCLSTSCCGVPLHDGPGTHLRHCRWQTRCALSSQPPATAHSTHQAAGSVIIHLHIVSDRSKTVCRLQTRCALSSQPPTTAPSTHQAADTIFKLSVEQKVWRWQTRCVLSSQPTAADGNKMQAAVEKASSHTPQTSTATLHATWFRACSFKISPHGRRWHW
jgi:hypothetical protein